ncbi:MAG: glycosyltransferase family 4 protein [Anaerolineae bacterium]|nr:glycosyltransferase family 4 protein [Anaerolineae bacterium]
MRVLMLSKACIVGIYQRKLEMMAALAPDMALTVAVPPYWKDERGVTTLESIHVSGYRLEVLPMVFNGQFHWHFYPTLGRLLRDVQPDIVHIDEEPYNLATYHANRLARQNNRKTLWFSWQNLVRRYPPPFAWMERYNMRHVDHALVGSQTAAQVWQQKGYRGPLSVIPQFGVDPDRFQPPQVSRSSAPIHIAYVGRLVPEKGIDVLLAALNGLAGDWRCTILGDGPDADQLRATTMTLGLAKRVTFSPWISSVNMPGFYQEVDVLVLPSRTRPNWIEQFGRVLIEAMACGVAVVGANTGEIPHVIGDAGLVFPEADVRELQDRLTQLIRDPDLRAALGTRGRERVLASFTQRQIAVETLQVYKELLQ